MKEKDQKFLTKEEIKEYIRELKSLQKSDDNESAHDFADNLLCEILVKLGLKKIVKEFDLINKWYG